MFASVVSAASLWFHAVMSLTSFLIRMATKLAHQSLSLFRESVWHGTMDSMMFTWKG